MKDITECSVRVMRSFDYCHFEVVLGTDDRGPLTPADVDELRKTAARLADKAVAQYKIAKANQEKLFAEDYERKNLIAQMDAIRHINEQDRSVRQQAQLKAFDDEQYHRSREYDYQDRWDEEND